MRVVWGFTSYFYTLTLKTFQNNASILIRVLLLKQNLGEYFLLSTTCTHTECFQTGEHLICTGELSSLGDGMFLR